MLIILTVGIALGDEVTEGEDGGEDEAAPIDCRVHIGSSFTHNC